MNPKINKEYCLNLMPQATILRHGEDSLENYPKANTILVIVRPIY